MTLCKEFSKAFSRITQGKLENALTAQVFLVIINLFPKQGYVFMFK